MELTLKLVPIGSVVELGGDTLKRRLYLGGMQSGFGLLWKSKADFEANKQWQVMTEPSTRIKNVTLPAGFDKENIVGWARDRVNSHGENIKA
jgi:hypothetical protein